MKENAPKLRQLCANACGVPERNDMARE